jgi:hypothetical protein
MIIARPRLGMLELVNGYSWVFAAGDGLGWILASFFYAPLNIAANPVLRLVSVGFFWLIVWIWGLGCLDPCFRPGFLVLRERYRIC